MLGNQVNILEMKLEAMPNPILDKEKANKQSSEDIVSAFEIAGLSPEERTAKKIELADRKQEVLQENGTWRATFLANLVNSRIATKTKELLGSKRVQNEVLNLTPLIGGVTSVIEAVIGKSLISKEKLDVRKRLCYVAAGIVAQYAWYKIFSQMDLEAAGGYKTLGTFLAGLGVLDKNLIVSTLSLAQDKLGPPLSVILSNLNNIVANASFSDIDLNFFRSDLEEHFKQLSISPEING